MEEIDGGCVGKPCGAQKNNHESLRDESSNENNNEIVPITSVSPKDYYYKMDHKHGRLLIVFNHKTFNENTNQPERIATERDVKKIEETFEQLGFQIHCHNDLTLAEIRCQIKEYVQQDYYHKNRDCLAIFILTHGEKDALWAKDKMYDPAKEIWGQFTGDKCPSFAGKPKLVFIQACQGNALDDGVKLRFLKTRTEFDGIYFKKIPICADILVSYATYKGYFAFRNCVSGSFWVTLLCDELQRNYKTEDLLTILTFVHFRMANEFSSRNTDLSMDGKKQIPVFHSSFTKRLVFGEK